MIMRKKHSDLPVVKADISLLLVNLIWGATFVTMKNLLESVPPLYHSLLEIYHRHLFASHHFSLFSKWHKVDWVRWCYLRNVPFCRLSISNLGVDIHHSSSLCFHHRPKCYTRTTFSLLSSQILDLIDFQ